MTPESRPGPERRISRWACVHGLSLFGVVAAVLLAAVGPVAAQTPIGGPVTTNTALLASDSPYRLTGDLVIRNGATLSIQPGVTVFVAPGVNLVLESGSIRSDGTEEDPVLITSDLDDGIGTPAPGDWGVLRFENGTNDAGTRLTWTTVRYGSGVELESASPTFNFCSITHMSGPAMSMDLDSFPSGAGNSASDCELNGVLVPAGDITLPGSWGMRGIPFVVRGQLSVGVSPAIVEITPSTVQRLDTVDVTLSGQRLAAATSFEVEATGVTATIQSGATDTSLTVEIAVAADAPLGTTPFAVVTPAGQATSAAGGITLTIVPPVPVLLDVAPDTVVAGSGAFTLTVNGERFAADAEVVLDGTPLPTTRLSATQMTADVDGSLILVPGDSAVTVRNLDPLNPGEFLQSAPRVLTVTSPVIALAPDPLLVISGQVANLLLSIPLVAPAGGLSFDVASSNDAVAAVPAQVTILAGSSSAPITVIGGTTGAATITAMRTGFIDGSAVVEVVPPPILIPVEPLLAPSVGVQVGEPPVTEETLTVDPLTADTVGVHVGAGLIALTPDRATQGDTGVTVTASGVGLDAVTSVELIPAAGLQLVGSPVVAPDGSAVDFTLNIDADAEPVTRRVLLQTADGPVPPASRGADQFLITRPTPEITSLAPYNVVPGSTVTLAVRGRNLQGVESVETVPPSGLTLGPPASNASGNLITLAIVVASDATLGPRTVRITTPGGTSTETSSVANTLNVVAELGAPITPLVAPPVGVEVAVAPPAEVEEPIGPVVAAPAGVIVGSGITGVVPDRANVGTDDLELTISGAGLEDTVAVSFEPSDGITLNSGPTAAPDGSEVSLNISIAGDAPTVRRTVLVETSAGLVQAASPGADRFDVTLPPPEVRSLLPNRGLLGASLTLTVNGLNLTGASAVTFEPPDGLGVNPPSVSTDGTLATVDVVIDANATLGTRVVRVETPGGLSDATATAANSFEVTDQLGTLITPLRALAVGVEVATTAVEPGPVPVGPVVSSSVGVIVEQPPAEDQPADIGPVRAPQVGVIVGAATTGIEPTTAAPGTVNLELAVLGVSLDGVTAIEFVPPDDITIDGPPTVAPDGSSATVTLSLGISAQRGFRRVVVSDASGPIQSGIRRADLFFVGDPPAISSIDPTVVAIGSAFVLTVNGSDLENATGVEFLPSDDIIVGAPTVNAGGTQLTVPVALAGNVTTGARVVTVTTPAGTSTTTASPANTLVIAGSSANLRMPLDFEPETSLPEVGIERVVTALPFSSRRPGPALPGSRRPAPVPAPAEPSPALVVSSGPSQPLNRSTIRPTKDTRLLIEPVCAKACRPTRVTSDFPRIWVPTATINGALAELVLPRPPTLNGDLDDKA